MLGFSGLGSRISEDMWALGFRVEGLGRTGCAKHRSLNFGGSLDDTRP